MTDSTGNAIRRIARELVYEVVMTQGRQTLSAEELKAAEAMLTRELGEVHGHALE